MEQLSRGLATIAEVVDLIGLAIVLLGAVKFLLAYVQIERQRLASGACTVRIQEARRLLGGYILVALEFMIVSDVINSVVSRTLESLAYLGAIVAVRTAIGFFLERELESSREAK